MKSEENEELKPCPFCGGKATIQGEDYANIFCGSNSCGMYLINKAKSCRDKKMAIKAWNTRKGVENGK